MNLREVLGRTEHLLLAAVLLVALGLRLWGSFFGLPHVYHPDEGFEVYRAVRLGMGEFDTARLAKGGYYFLLFVEYGAFFVWSFITGAISGVGEFAQLFVRDPSPFWKIGRVTTACLGTFTVFLVWFQGRRMGSSRAALLGALFLAVSFQHVIDSHYVTVDVPMTLFAFWTVVLIVEDLSGRTPLGVWRFAVVAALAVLCKLPAVVIFVPYFVAAYLRGGLRGPEGILSRATWLPATATAAIYCLANPGVVLGFGGLVRAVFAIFTSSPDGGAHYAGVEQKTNLWVFYAQSLLRSQGPALLALSAIGAAIGIARRSQGALLHLAFIVPFFVLVAAASTAHLYYPRYIVPLLPGLCLLAGLALDELVRRIQSSPGPAGAIAAATAVLLVVEPGLAAAQWNQRMTRTDTRTQAAEWIERNLPHRTRILLEGYPEEAAQLSIPLGNTKKNIRAMIERLRAQDPGKAMYWEMKVDVEEPPLYDLVTVRHFEPWGTLGDFLHQGVEYIVLRREYFVAGSRSAPKHDAGVVESRYRFYLELVAHQRAERVAFFPASEYGHPGFDLEIWKLSPDGDQTLAGTDGFESAS